MEGSTSWGRVEDKHIYIVNTAVVAYCIDARQQSLHPIVSYVYRACLLNERAREAAV